MNSKAELRRRFRRLRRQALEEAGQALPSAILAVATELLGSPGTALRQGKRLGLYWPLAGEIDLRPLAQRAAVALPAIQGGRLLYRPWQPGDPLHADACGIPAPLPEAGSLAPGELGLLLIPALAIDPTGFRLGSGGGWYDRLRAEPAWRQLPAMAVLPAICCGVALPSDPWDVPLSGWISERGPSHCRGAEAGTAADSDN